MSGVSYSGRMSLPGASVDQCQDITPAPEALEQSEHAVWLVKFFDLVYMYTNFCLDKLDIEQKGSVLLHLSSNSQHPEKLDGDTEKLRNVLHLLCGKSDVETNQLLTVSLMYDNLNPYLTGLFLAIFKLLLSILEFLASPYQMPALATACTNILGSRGANDDLSDTDCQHLLEHMYRDTHTALQDPQYTLMVTVLETFDPDSLLTTWNDIFSEKLLPYMHLFGTSNQRNIKLLTNLVTKLHWVQLGFHPNNEPLIKLDTPNLLFTDLSMVVMLGNWNATKISICKGDEMGCDINFGPALAEVTDWLFPLCQYPMSGQCRAKHAWSCVMGRVRVFLQNCLDIKDTRKQQMCINQFISLLAGNHQVALTEVRFIFSAKDIFTSFTKAYCTELAGAKPSLGRSMASNKIYNDGLDGSVTEEHKTYFQQQGKSTIAWSHWDSITEQPALNCENPILALLPTSYSGETLGMAMEHAASAPEDKADNVTMMCKIVDLISVPTFGLCQYLATVSVKKTLCIHEPTLDLSSGSLALKVQELLTSLGYGINLQDLHFMDTQEAKEHWQGHTVEELDPHGKGGAAAQFGEGGSSCKEIYQKAITAAIEVLVWPITSMLHLMMGFTVIHSVPSRMEDEEGDDTTN
ncbi:hypothetical protein EDC04DRAFT_2606008 [Pisolithus marmoratus]|nr:hypothetical protein EDC04DRAFT_2606008 [Pisolithus marmoratus]